LVPSVEKPRLRRTLASLLITLLPALAAAQTNHVARPQPLVLTHVNVIDLTGANPKADMTVIIAGDRIAAVVTRGRYLSRESLDRILADVEAAAADGK
jgi:hypothetical protein